MTSSPGDDAGSPPCRLRELDADGRMSVDPRRAADVARWRKAVRQRLIAGRQQLSAEYRTEQTSAMCAQLDRLVPGARETVVSVYWPIRAEPDLRAWMRSTAQAGVRVALPVAVSLNQPLTFREWHPGAPLSRGLWKIPYPADGAQVVPTVVIAPLVGFDRARYRLGYGGGFFDRTLAGMTSRPLAIGVGYPQALIDSIFPQPHDIPMSHIVTGAAMSFL